MSNKYETTKISACNLIFTVTIKRDEEKKVELILNLFLLEEDLDIWLSHTLENRCQVLTTDPKRR